MTYFYILKKVTEPGKIDKTSIPENVWVWFTQLNFLVLYVIKNGYLFVIATPLKSYAM